MSEELGDGFIVLADGSRRWGRFGAAGLLLRHVDEAGTPFYFVARRSSRSHDGGTWGIPGGAMHRGELPFDAAMREFREEIGYDVAAGPVLETFEDNHGGWSYWTFLMEVTDRQEGQERLNWENDEARWVAAEALGELDLFVAFRTTLRHFGVL
jgi:8-oxo-dGTP diphosphatase